MTADMDNEPLAAFLKMSLESIEIPAEKTSSGSGSVEGDKILTVQSLGAVTGPYGTADNTYATADQNPVAPGFIGTVSDQMDYRADCDPAYQYIARATPRSFGYLQGYLTGTTAAPNGLPTGVGIVFPTNPVVGDYFLRIDYFPQLLFRWSGQFWARISANVRTETGFTAENNSQLSSFINNDKQTKLTDGTLVPQKQGLSTLLAMTPDVLPPVV
jgi:hypothetical protein